MGSATFWEPILPPSRVYMCACCRLVDRPDPSFCVSKTFVFGEVFRAPQFIGLDHDIRCAAVPFHLLPVRPGVRPTVVEHPVTNLSSSWPPGIEVYLWGSGGDTNTKGSGLGFVGHSRAGA